MNNLIIFGPPGSGKGTQSEKLIEKYGLLHISTGDVIRNEIKNKTEIGVQAEALINDGQLVPDEMIISILKNWISSKDISKGVIFDGFPRTVPQAEALTGLMNSFGTAIHKLVCLQVPEEELIGRLLKRGQESGRSDDNRATIEKRMQVYVNQTAPVIEYYQEQGVCAEINGLGTVDEIFNRICGAIES